MALFITVARGDPFQFTIESLVKPVPVIISCEKLAPQNGAEFGESDVSIGGVPGAALTVKRTTFETSLVVVE